MVEQNAGECFSSLPRSDHISPKRTGTPLNSTTRRTVGLFMRLEYLGLLAAGAVPLVTIDEPSAQRRVSERAVTASDH